MAEVLFSLLEKGQVMTDAIQSIRNMIKTNKLHQLTDASSLKDISTAMISSFQFADGEQIESAIQMIVEFVTACHDALNFFNNDQFFNFWNNSKNISVKALEYFTYLLGQMVGNEQNISSKVKPEMILSNILNFSVENQIAGLDVISTKIEAEQASQASYIPTIFSFISSENSILKESAFLCLADIFSTIPISEYPFSTLIEVLNQIPSIQNTATILKLLQCVDKGMSVKEFFYAILETMFTFYYIPLLDNIKGDKEIIALSMQICINFFPKNPEFPPEFSLRSTSFGINNNKFLVSAAPYVAQIFLKYPKETKVAAAFMQTFKFSKTETNDAFFLALKECGTVTNNLPYVLYICSLLDDASPITKYRINMQLTKGRQSFSSPWYTKLFNIVLKKCPQGKSEDTILEYGELNEILDLISTGAVSIEKLVNKNVFHRLTELIKEHGTVLDIDVNHAISSAISIMTTLPFEHLQSPWRSSDIDSFMNQRIVCELHGERQTFRLRTCITMPLSYLEGEYNKRINPIIANQLHAAIAKNDRLRRIIVPNFDELDPRDLANSMRLSVLCRIFDVKEYKRFSFKVNDITFTIDDSLSTVLASKVETLLELMNMSIRIDLVPEVENRESLLIPPVILPDAYTNVLDFLKTVHDMCPQISMKRNEFTKRVIENIKSPIEAVLRKSPEICFVYTYPFMFTFEEKLFVANTVLATPLETVEAFAYRMKIKFDSPAIRHKCMVSRKEIYSMGSDALKLAARASLNIGFIFEGETGFGRGPTQEFFTLMSRELMKKERHMWRTDDVEGEYAFSKNGLFPRPDANPEDFYVLGILASKALQETKFLETELSTPFVKLINGESITMEDVDSMLAHSLQYPEGLVGLDFTYPGIPEIGRDGVEVTEDNVKEYIEFVIENTIGKPILKLVEQFKAGFLRNAEISAMSLFESSEFARALCGDTTQFNESDLKLHIKAEHGYNSKSREFKELVSCLVSFTPDQQRQFCKFITGSERLPPGGIAALKPQLTVAKRDGGDETLPSVSTCANYLKLPSYSSKEILKDRLLTAILEGNTFELS